MFRYLEVYFAAIIILQVIRCCHNIVDCHFCLGRRWWECFIGKLGFLTYGKSILEIVSNQSCFNIETTVCRPPEQCRFASHWAAEDGRSSSSSPHGRNAERWSATQATCSEKKIRVKKIFFQISPEGIWGRSLVSCWRTGCSLHSSACAQSFDPRPWAFVWNQL